MWLIYDVDGTSPHGVILPRRLDYEIGTIWPRKPFQVPEEIGRHLLGPRGNPRFRLVDDPEERPLPIFGPPPPPLIHDSPPDEAAPEIQTEPADDAGSSVSVDKPAAPRRRAKGARK